jgi:urease accessory protein UreH
MELGQGSVYKGYTFWKRDTWWQPSQEAQPGTWGAYSCSASVAWFTGETAEDLVEQIDKALAEVPDPVY